jgi:hypothetical protein
VAPGTNVQSWDEPFDFPPTVEAGARQPWIMFAGLAAAALALFGAWGVA